MHYAHRVHYFDILPCLHCIFLIQRYVKCFTYEKDYKTPLSKQTEQTTKPGSYRSVTAKTGGKKGYKLVNKEFVILYRCSLGKEKIKLTLKGASPGLL